MARNLATCPRAAHILAAIALSVGLSACSGDSWFGDNTKPPDPGTRVSVLEHDRSLKGNAELTSSIRLPAPEENPASGPPALPRR